MLYTYADTRLVVKKKKPEAREQALVERNVHGRKLPSKKKKKKKHREMLMEERREEGKIRRGRTWTAKGE